MSRIVAQAFITLDGVVQAVGGPDEDREGGFEHGGWTTQYDAESGGEEMGEIVEEWESRTEALLLGRKTYQIFARSWGMWDEDAEGLQGGEIRVWGSTQLIKTLAEHDLFDEYRLAVYPLVLGTGKKLFSDGFALTKLTLVESRALPNGVLVNTYRRGARPSLCSLRPPSPAAG